MCDFLIANILLPLGSGILGVLGSLWLVSYKFQHAVYLDLVKKRLVALQNFLFLVEVFLKYKKKDSDLPQELIDKLTKENLTNSVFIPPELRDDWDNIWPHLTDLLVTNKINELNLNIDSLRKTKNKINNYINKEYKKVNILEKGLF